MIEGAAPKCKIQIHSAPLTSERVEIFHLPHRSLRLNLAKNSVLAYRLNKISPYLIDELLKPLVRDDVKVSESCETNICLFLFHLKNSVSAYIK